MAINKGFHSLCARDPQWQQHNPPHQVPIYAASSFNFDTIEQGMAIFDGEKPGHVYTRFGNPTIDAVADKIALLESYELDKAEAKALLTSSGMAAITVVAMGLLKQGEKVLTHADLYGGTTSLFHQVFAPLGIEVCTVDFQDLQAVTDILRNDSAIRIIYCETPSNPLLRCIDLAQITSVATEANVYTVVDNTFATPVLQQPLSLGADFVIHSTTKYLNGHGNGIAGVVVSRDPELLDEKLVPKLRLLGCNASPWEAWLIHNGLKTLALRMEKHSTNARAVAAFLDQHPNIEQVHALSLESHPEYHLAQRQMKNSGGMLSFALKGGLKEGMSFMNRLKFCTLTPTLGDVDTLVLHPATMSHRSVPADLRAKLGISDGLIRLSVGIEDVRDIIADLEQALS